MIIYCTKKLMEGLPVSTAAPVAWNPLYCWHANLIRVERHKTVVLVHDHSRYVIVLHGLKVKDMANFGALVNTAIRETLIAEGVRPEVIKRFLDDSGEVSYAPAKNRSSISRVNRACAIIEYDPRFLNEDTISQTEPSMKLSRILVGGGDDYIIPSQEMFKYLEKLAHGSLISCRKVELQVTLELDSVKVTRTLQVPLSYSFRRLHNVIQAAFGWTNSHLHEFTIQEGDVPIVRIISDEEPYELPQVPTPVRFEGSVRLSEYLPNHSTIEYQYDFGDCWTHRIDVLRVIEDSPNAKTTCTAGEGDTPPEDVGGAPGYTEFLNVIKDNRHPEYRQIMQWAKSQGYRSFNLEQVNRDLSLYS